METEHLRFVIVGHIDHGKSTLIGRLFYDTGSLPQEKIDEVKEICDALGRDMEFAYVMDHLEEERDQGITIDTAQTFFHTEKRDYVIIDAPGHREFTKNMITGASQAEAGILIVDADEGVQEQTRRHAYILNLLGLKQVIVAINKMDLVDNSEERFKEVSGDVSAFLERIKIKPSFIIPIVAKDGDNISNRSEKMVWYTGHTILSALDTFVSSKQKTENQLRFPIQDAYNIEGKRIFVGRVEAGQISEGDEIAILPGGEKTRVTGVEEFLNPEKRTAYAGESTGITIAEKLFVDRGNVVCKPDEMPIITREIKGNLFWMDKNPLKKGEQIVFKCSTQEAKCTVKAILDRMDSSTLEVVEEDADILNNREVGEVVLSFSQDIVVDDFNKTPELGRFVIEKDYNNAGGGIITHLGGE